MPIFFLRQIKKLEYEGLIRSIQKITYHPPVIKYTKESYETTQHVTNTQKVYYERAINRALRNKIADERRL